MDVQTSLLGLETPGGRTISQSLIRSELPLPEGRDVSEVLLVQARATTETAACGRGVVEVGGRLELNCVCRGLSGEIYGFSAGSAFTHSIPMDRAEETMAAEVTAQVLECGASPDGLRLQLNAVLELSAFLIVPVKTPFLTGVSGASAMEQRKKSLSVSRKVCLGETTLRLREENDAHGVMALLVYSGETEVTKVHFSGANLCETEGKVLVTALVETENGSFRQMLFSLPFTCSFDAAFQPDVWVEATLVSLSVIAADVSFGVADTEAVVKLSLMGVETVEHEVLEDAYACDGGCTCNQLRVDRLLCRGCGEKTFTLTENVLIPENTAGAALPDAKRAVAAYAMPAVTGLFQREGCLYADAMLLTGVLYEDGDGRLRHFTEDIPVQLGFDAPFTPDAVVELCTLSTEAAGAGRTLSVTYTLRGRAVLYDTEGTLLAESLTPGTAGKAHSGILLYAAGEGETAWDVGKRFQVPVDALHTWNGALSEPLSDGQMIVLIR